MSNEIPGGVEVVTLENIAYSWRTSVTLIIENNRESRRYNPPKLTSQQTNVVHRSFNDCDHRKKQIYFYFIRIITRFHCQIFLYPFFYPLYNEKFDYI